jgi:hypothetical protein
MDPNQQDNSLGGPTDVPTPEVTPTTPNTEPVAAPTSDPVPDPALPLAPESITPTTSLTPQTPITPGQPIGTTDPFPEKKSKKGLVIGIIASVSVLIIVGVVLILIFFVFNDKQDENPVKSNNPVESQKTEDQKTIKSYAEFKDAIDNQKAMNCDMKVSQNELTIDMTMQANDGWSKLYFAAPAMMGVEMWSIKEGDKYTTYGTAMGLNIKSTKTEAEFMQEMGVTAWDDLSYEDSIKELNCKPNNQADFTVPDRDWKENGSLF